MIVSFLTADLNTTAAYSSKSALYVLLRAPVIPHFRTTTYLDHGFDGSLEVWRAGNTVLGCVTRPEHREDLATAKGGLGITKK